MLPAGRTVERCTSSSISATLPCGTFDLQHGMVRRMDHHAPCSPFLSRFQLQWHPRRDKSNVNNPTQNRVGASATPHRLVEASLCYNNCYMDNMSCRPLFSAYVPWRH
ncbi:hypothetical protein BRADI_4g24726v3 [Brachypodium distachyon]|uniref:Uncharacterized protein n=1 Tax=Brachypodium distachyon TaxID=15368 RepID=A0A0Q3EP22_BRADI|nr:hypothetical protein BRADI_4g24726v3 [Brachypodium distachyon]